jgi:tetratricopeptide (TPR) repeat protein
MEEAKVNQNSGVYFKNLGNEKFKAGEYQEALACYSKAIVITYLKIEFSFK